MKVCVCGLGLSGRAAAKALRAAGDLVYLLDERDPDALHEIPADTELVVVSPGWRPDHPLLRGLTVPVIGEVELAWELGSRATRWFAVTGTNGKTTTTELLSAMTGAPAAGNIGTPLVEAVRTEPPMLAVELSSFQLHWAPSVRPWAGALLNIAPDHLDWHGSFEAYAAAKSRIWSGNEVSIASVDLPIARPRNAMTFGPGGDLRIERGSIVDTAFGHGELVAVEELGLRGPHNLSNALAATAMALAAGVPVGTIVATLRQFRPGRHRNEVVATSGGVTWVDDSKATNPHAAAASLSAYDRVVWVAGGLNKGLGFDELVAGARDRLAGVVLIGTCADEIAEALARHAPEVPVHRADAMQTAVEIARGLARPGDTVLLAPAAASMDMFRDYAERGDAFAAAAREMV